MPLKTEVLVVVRKATRGFDSLEGRLLYTGVNLVAKVSKKQIRYYFVGGQMKKHQKGFSLIELLIVVAIILIIAAIAIPNLLRSKMAANEASAVATLRTLNTSAVAYSTTYGQYPTKLTDLGPNASPGSTGADLVDSVLGNDPATKSGYTFVWVVGASNGSYTLTATPVTQGVSGQRGFFTNQSGVIRADSAGSATSASTPLG
jgi:type IV pilus assembly protein PilA